MRRTFVTIALASALALSGAAARTPFAAARNGAITGHVDLRRPIIAPTRRPGVSDLGTAPVQPMPERQMSVVYLETAPRGAFEQNEPGHATMDQRNETFVPHVLAVTTGTIVEFPNSDRIFHNVFSMSKTHPFDLGRYAVGHSKSIKFDRPGIVRVFCDIHSHMASNPHPEHTDCTEINSVGFLNPGQSRQTGNLNTARTCGFHDHSNPDNTNLQGSIVVQ